MFKRKISCLIFALFLLILFFPISSMASFPCSVSGYVYVNGEICDPEGVVLSFPGQDISADLFGSGFYVVDFTGNIGDAGVFTVTIDSIDYAADETITVLQGTTIYEINLTVTVPEEINHPPDVPTDEKPQNNSINIGLNPTLEVFVTDPDDDIMDVTFYNASDDSVLGTAPNVANSSTGSIIWNNLDFNKTYSWYAVADDGEFETKSDVFTFKTIEEDNMPPSVCFEKPEEGSLYLFGNRIFQGILKMPFIIGSIEIFVNATDEESGISKVELKINGFLTDINESLTEQPYTYEWSRLAFGKYNLTATAYDNAGNSAETSITVRKLL